MAIGKDKRRALVMEIISEQEVSSQEQLQELLHSRGITTTQATISRDIRDLGLVKAATGSGIYRYLPVNEEGSMAGGAGNTFPPGVVQSVKAAGNLVVVHTRPGFAQSVAAGLDSLGWNEVIGTVGGDDTVLVVTGEVQAAARIKNRMARVFSMGPDH
ncbi:MAG: arginine repressor [Gemmatimonadota bacterium]|nr:arginine repressor [Gemmatimonadota bacterium]